MKSKKLTAVVLAGATTVGLGVMAIPGGAATLPHSSVNWATVTHLTKTGPEDFGNLKKAAEAEGHLNVITLPSNWANYGTIISDFSAQVPHRDQLGEPRRIQPGRAQRDQGGQGPRR